MWLFPNQKNTIILRKSRILQAYPVGFHECAFSEKQWGVYQDNKNLWVKYLPSFPIIF